MIYLLWLALNNLVVNIISIIFLNVFFNGMDLSTLIFLIQINFLSKSPLLAHILFDDAFEFDEEEDRVPNAFVKLFMEVMQEAAK